MTRKTKIRKNEYVDEYGNVRIKKEEDGLIW
jgi:hypothetical protein